MTGSGRSPGGGKSNPLQYSCLGNPMDRGAWRAMVRGVENSWTRLSVHMCVHSRVHTHACRYVLLSPDVKSQLIGKDPDAGKEWRQKEKGATEDEMVRWHHWLNGDNGGERSLVCCSPWGRKELDTTEQLNDNMCQSQSPNSSHPTPCPTHFSTSLGRQGLGFRKKEGWWKGSYFVSVWFLFKPFTLLLHCQDSCSGGGSNHAVGQVVLLIHHWWISPEHSPRSRHILTPFPSYVNLSSLFYLREPISLLGN